MPLTPIQAATNVIDRARALLTQAEAPGTPHPVAEELHRLAVVMAVAALDTYMHVLVLNRLSSTAPIPKELEKLNVPFGALAEIVRGTLEARRKTPAGQRPNDRPWVRVKSHLRTQLLTLTFQSSTGVEKAVSMCGVKGFWAKVSAKHATHASAEDLKRRLDQIVRRRNQIVHEGDLQRQSKPRQAKLNAMSHAEGTADVDWIDELIKAIDRAI